MAQFAGPDSDVAAGLWTTAPLWSKLDEAAADDVDRIASPRPAVNHSCEVSLSDVIDPQSSAGHVIRCRARRVTGGVGTPPTVTLDFRLRQGAVTIGSAAQQSFVDADTNLWRDISYTLSAAEADAITDYTDLRFLLLANGGDGIGDDAGTEVSWTRLEVPDAPVAAAASPIAAGSGVSQPDVPGVRSSEVL